MVVNDRESYCRFEEQGKKPGDTHMGKNFACFNHTLNDKG